MNNTLAEIRKLEVIIDELETAYNEALATVKGIERDISDTARRIKVCHDEMKKQLKPRKKLPIHN